MVVAFVNFSPATTWLELAVWLAYLVAALTLFILTSRRDHPAVAGRTGSVGTPQHQPRVRARRRDRGAPR